jgi:NAD(P)-dependent dehydrogenase (short-subunit alcohol dehydrogenase family)
MNSKKYALVTGAGGGIGLAISAKLQHLGFFVILVDNREEELQIAKDSIPDSVAFSCDIKTEKSILELASFVSTLGGQLEVVVNAAGVFFEHDVTSLREEDYDLIMDVNVKGTFLVSKHFIPELEKNKTSHLINISSTAGLRGSTNRAVYSASKAAVIMLTKSIARDHGPKGLRANVICPGLIRLDTAKLAEWEKTVPSQRIGTPEDIAGAVEFLISESASYVQGHALIIDGGGTA